MRLNRAIIQIQELNCQNCAIKLASKLSQIKYISQLQVDYQSSEVYFNFQNIAGVADLENMLAELGFNPVGEKIRKQKSEFVFCKNASKNLCINKTL